MAKRTTDPKPGFRRIGASYTICVARKGSALECFFPKESRGAFEFARSISAQYDEVIIVEGTLRFRIWNPDEATDGST